MLVMLCLALSRYQLHAAATLWVRCVLADSSPWPGNQLHHIFFLPLYTNISESP